MAPYLGDIAEDATVAFTWDTNGSDGESITRATNGTIKVRRLDDGTDCTGTSVTDTEDTPDTGIHECKIDTSDNVNFTTGNDYTVWLDGSTVDGQTVNATLVTFSIQNRYTGANVTEWLGTAAATPTVAGVLEVDLTHMAGVVQSVTDLKDFADAGYNPATHKVVGVVLADTTTTNTDLVTAADVLSAMQAAGTHLTLIKAVTDVLPDAGALTTIASDTARLTAARAAVLTDWINGGRLDLLLDAIPTTAMRGTDSAALATVCTEGRLAELDAGNLPTDIAAIPTTAMRGTDSAALATVCTETRLAELDAGNLPTDVGAIPTTAMRGTDSAALATVCTEGRLSELDSVNLPTDVAAIPTTAMRGTDSAATATDMATALAALVQLLASGYDSNTVVSNVITLSNGKTITINADGSRTTSA